MEEAAQRAQSKLYVCSSVARVWLRCQVKRKDEAKKTEMRGRIRWRKEEEKGRSGKDRQGAGYLKLLCGILERLAYC